MPFKIMVVDDHINDEKNIIYEFPPLLRATGYEVVTTSDANAAYDLVWEQNPDLIVLDILFPNQEINGIELCRAIREAGSRVPIILITGAFRETEDVLQGFEAGADDYVIFPCDNRELLARVRANLPPEIVEIDGRIRIDFGGRRLWVKRNEQWQEIHLQRLQFELLHTLVVNAGLVVPSTTIKDRVWCKDVSDGVLAVYIRRLREKVEPNPKRPLYIETIHRLGYRFNGRPIRARLPEGGRR